jgi:putative membrane protein
MKRLSAVIPLTLSVCVLLSCNNKAKNYNTTAAKDTDSTDVISDTTTVLHLAVDKDDSQFAALAAAGGVAQIQLGKMAVARGRSKKVKNFGNMMIKDHDKAANKLAVIAKAKNITLPTTPDTSMQRVINLLSKKSGSDFDKAYITEMIAAHQKYVGIFKHVSVTCQDPDLKAFAKSTLPIIQNQLDAINAIHDSMGQ